MTWGRLRVRVLFKPRLLLIGVFWRRQHSLQGPGPTRISTATDVWVCLLPMLPIHFSHVRDR